MLFSRRFSRTCLEGISFKFDVCFIFNVSLGSAPKRKNFDIQRNTRVGSGGQLTSNRLSNDHIYLMNLSLPGLLLAAWHQGRSSRPRTAGRTCSQRRVTWRRRQGQNHQFQGFRSLFRNIFRKTMKHEVECMYVSSWLQFISPGSCARRVNE